MVQAFYILWKLSWKYCASIYTLSWVANANSIVSSRAIFANQVRANVTSF